MENTGLNYYVSHFFFIGGKLGVNIFILISGYFLVEKKISIKKIIQLYLEIIFYTIGLSIVSMIVFKSSITLSDIRQMILPITSNTYWFVTSYIFMYIVSPYINKFVRACTKVELKKVIILLVLIASIIPTFLNIRTYYHTYLWFICVYLIAAYIKIYDVKMESKKAFKWFGIMYLLIFASIILLRFIGKKPLEVDQLALDFSFVELLAAIFIFLGFKNMKEIKNIKINMIASTAFGIYLFQSHFIFFKRGVWEYIKNYNLNWHIYYFACIIAISFVIFLVGMLIEFIRKTIFKYTVDKILNMNN